VELTKLADPSVFQRNNTGDGKMPRLSKDITNLSTETTVEDLEIQLDEEKHWADWCEVEVEIDAQPEEKMTFDPPYPGCEASAAISTFKVIKVYATDNDGDEVRYSQKLACKIVQEELEKRGWADDQDDWALATISDHVQGLEDEYWEAKLQAHRDGE
jgi:hypothetical protein